MGLDMKEDNIMFIKNYGLFWKRDDVWWGAGGQRNAGILQGKDAKNLNTPPVDLNKKIGLYALYNICGNRNILDTRDIRRDPRNPSFRDGFRDPYGKNDELVYCGYSGTGIKQTLFYRIKQHQQPAEILYGKWNQFSWFGIGELDDDNMFPQGNLTNKKITRDFLKQIEGVMIATSRPVENHEAGVFRKATKYLQHPDPRARSQLLR